MIDLVQAYSQLLKQETKLTTFIGCPVSLIFDPLCPPNCIWVKSGKNEYQVINIGEENEYKRIN